MNDAVASADASADLDPIDRLAILAAALPGAVVRQRRVAAPFEAVWRIVADLEHAVPSYEPGVAHVRIVERDDQLLRLLVRDTGGREYVMDARLRPGWCLMQSASIVVAFAARRVGSQTLLAHLEHRRVQLAQAPLPGESQSRHRRAAEEKIDRELQAIEKLATHS